MWLKLCGISSKGLPVLSFSWLQLLFPFLKTTSLKFGLTTDQLHCLMFFSRILSKILYNYLKHHLPSLIFEEQTGFVQRRNIHDNLMLAEEIIHAINYSQLKDNVILKMDVSKAYDRLKWDFLKVIMQKMKVNKQLMKIILKYLANSWFSVRINGQNRGFFTSTRGLRQGNPLSPCLFYYGYKIFGEVD